MTALRLIVATGNPGKLREFREILRVDANALGSLSDVAQVVLPEEGQEYEANAIAKAQAVTEQAGIAAIADDSGLEVDGLEGAPGPLSARYGGPALDDRGRVSHLLAELRRHPDVARTARFVCVAALTTPDGEVHTARGVCEGEILPSPAGEGGFGYDPIFRPDGFPQAMAALPTNEKNRISHRGRALAALASEIARVVGSASSD